MNSVCLSLNLENNQYYQRIVPQYCNLAYNRDKDILNYESDATRIKPVEGIDILPPRRREKPRNLLTDNYGPASSCKGIGKWGRENNARMVYGEVGMGFSQGNSGANGERGMFGGMEGEGAD